MAATERHFGYWEALQREIGFSQAVRSGDMLYISGTAPLSADFKALHPGDFEGQIRFVYSQIRETLQHFGADFSKVVREVIYATDMKALLENMVVRKIFYGEGPFPASTAVEVKSLVLPEIMIEVEITATLA